MGRDYIYPECPDCGNKASEGHGVTLDQMLNQPFDWQCNECERIHTGTFWPGMRQPDWSESRDPSAIERAKSSLFG